MTTLTVLSMFQEITNMNGDASNANILARRGAWGGVGVDVVFLGPGDLLPAAVPDIVIIGSAPESKVPHLIDKLWPHRSALQDWVNSGVGLLAVSTGWEVLCESVDLSANYSVDGLGIFPGNAMWQSVRVSDDLVVASPFGVLVGYENHRRAYVTSADARPLGRIIYGHGNGLSSGMEGLLAGTAIGTHLHGPVLAKNPALADYLLEMAVNRLHGDPFIIENKDAERVDGIARNANDQILSRLHVSSEKLA
jgi:CobQ-like glutamine amidotransferase family enzyme